MPNQAAIDAENAAFWDELCGSQLARAVGVTGRDVGSLAKFDQAYFDFYPYLLDEVKPFRMRGKRVLEIGLGYGSLGQVLAQNAGEYVGMDIARGPVAMMRHRLAQARLGGRAVEGSALATGFPDGAFDFVVSIGCFHHTGDVTRCFEEAARILAPGGSLVAMIYARRSLDRVRAALLRRSPVATYDTNLAGQAAPQTTFHSTREVRGFAHGFARVRIRRRNLHDGRALGLLMPRETQLRLLAPLVGCDLYVEATRASSG